MFKGEIEQFKHQSLKKNNSSISDSVNTVMYIRVNYMKYVESKSMMGLYCQTRNRFNNKRSPKLGPSHVFREEMADIKHFMIILSISKKHMWDRIGKPWVWYNVMSVESYETYQWRISRLHFSKTGYLLFLSLSSNSAL